MKRIVLSLAIVLSVVFILCAAKPKAAEIPSIDYSKIGPNDSAILVYVDPTLVTTESPSLMMDTELYKKEVVFFEVVLEPGGIKSGQLTTIKPPKKPSKLAPEAVTQKSFQMQIPNGTYTISVHSSSPYNIGSYEIMPFTAAFDNVAVTYKLRPATNEEKTAAKIGLGNKVYTLEEISQKKLR